MTPAEEVQAEAIAAKVESILARRTASRQAPKNGSGRLLAWAAGVAGVLAAAAALAAVDTWRGLAVVEAKQGVVDTAITEIKGDTAYLKTNMDQLLGRLGVTPVKP
jgi:hypothetical protein